MTKDELKAELDALGVEYPKNASLADLEGLYAPYSTATDAAKGPEGAFQKPRDESVASPTIDPDHAVVAAEHGLNVRTVPNGKVLCVLPDGTECDVLDADGEWSRVSFRFDGWVRSEFLAQPSVARGTPAVL